MSPFFSVFDLKHNILTVAFIVISGLHTGLHKLCKKPYKTAKNYVFQD